MQRNNCQREATLEVELRKSVRFDGGVPWQLDSCARRNARLGDEDKEDSISEDLPAISLVRPLCI